MDAERTPRANHRSTRPRTCSAVAGRGLLATNPFLLLVGVVLPLALLKTRLTVIVEVGALSVRLIYLTHKRVPVSRIAAFRAVDYMPIRDYGGWGIKYLSQAQAQALGL